LVELRGIISFTLAFALAAALLLTASLEKSAGERLGEAKSVAVEIERNSFLRSALEENIDALIERTLESEIRKGNIEPEKISSEIERNLLELFSEFEREFSKEPKIEFFLIDSGTVFRGVPTAEEFLEIRGLEKLFKTIVVSPEEHVFLAEITYTGGEGRRTLLAGKISSAHSTSYFLLPAGYTVKKTVVRI